ncbi:MULTISPECIES: hypothetical protein [Kosakonia]|uniref:hypothetical protein n=1 Tax=Kosakonia TaxID=1330547 RepID=UPI00201E2D95|nr:MULTISPECIES: hypothetical protein [Kosakonia]MCL6746068.1 hypothetical protein [Kosakonia sp. R1.Fl]MDZ7321296.1 hypothetical protein [Kosakonia sacchari]
MLTKIQETSFSDLLEANFDTSFSTLKAGVSNMVLDAKGKPHGLSGSNRKLLDKHGMSQV